MSFPDGAPSLPPLSPPPRARAVARAGRSAPYGYATAAPLLSTPAGVERGALIWLLRAGYATTARKVALHAGAPLPPRNGRSQRLCHGTPRLAAAPASNGTEDDVTSLLPCLAHGRPHSGRRWGCAAAQPLTTTASPQSPPSIHGGDASFRRSLSRKPEAKSKAPSPARRGGRGRGERVGKEMRHAVVHRLAREKAGIPSQDTRGDE